MIVDPDFYSNGFGNDLFVGFQKENRKAQMKVAYATFGRAEKIEKYPSDIQKKIKFAICALIELNQERKEKEVEKKEDRRIASETVGKHSISYRYGDEETTRKSDRQTKEDLVSQEEYTIIAQYLAHTGLMYRGVYYED